MKPPRPQHHRTNNGANNSSAKPRAFGPSRTQGMPPDDNGTVAHNNVGESGFGLRPLIHRSAQDLFNNNNHNSALQRTLLYVSDCLDTAAVHSSRYRQQLWRGGKGREHSSSPQMPRNAYNQGMMPFLCIVALLFENPCTDFGGRH